MPQAVRYITRRCITLYHHTTERDADALHGTLCHSVLLVAVPAAELAADAVLLAELIPRRIVVQRLTISAQDGKLVRSILIVMLQLQALKRFESITLAVEHIDPALTREVVDIQLKAVIIVLCISYVQVFPVVDSLSSVVLHLGQRLLT